MRIPLLPRWVRPSASSIYDLESATISEMVPRLYGVIKNLVEDYNKLADEINEEIKTFTGSSSEEIENFKKSIEQRLICKFNAIDQQLHRIRLDLKKYTDEELQNVLETFGVTVKVTGEKITVTDSTNEKIRALSVFGTTTQMWDPLPEYPAAFRSAGSSGSIDISISNAAGNKQQSITIATPEGLPGIPVASGGNYTDSNGQRWICDELDLRRGVYVQRVKEISLDGSADEVWNEDAHDGIHRHIINFANVFCRPSGRTECICTHSKYGLGTDTGTCFIGSEGAFYFYKNDSDHAAFIQWLKSNTIKVLYALAEPVERPLTTAELAVYEQLHTYLPETTVTADPAAGIMLEYVAITQKYIENHIAERSEEITRELVAAAIQNGDIGIELEYDEETEEIRLVTTGGV